MASQTVDPIDWSHHPPSWAVLPERLVHSINQRNLSGNRTYNLSMWCNHLANAATQGIKVAKFQSNYNISKLQLPTTDQQRGLEIIITKDLKWQNQTKKSCKTAKRILWVHCTKFQVQKQRTDPPIIQITSPSTFRTWSAILVHTF